MPNDYGLTKSELFMNLYNIIMVLSLSLYWVYIPVKARYGMVIICNNSILPKATLLIYTNLFCEVYSHYCYLTTKPICHFSVLYLCLSMAFTADKCVTRNRTVALYCFPNNYTLLSQRLPCHFQLQC